MAGFLQVVSVLLIQCRSQAQTAALSSAADLDGGPPTLQRERTVAEALTAPTVRSESTRTPSSQSDGDQASWLIVEAHHQSRGTGWWQSADTAYQPDARQLRAWAICMVDLLKMQVKQHGRCMPDPGWRVDTANTACSGCSTAPHRSDSVCPTRRALWHSTS